MSRAKRWTPEVEDAFRMQEAGYRGLEELAALGLEPPERWPESGFIRKLQTRHSLGTGERVLLYFRRAPECEPRYLNRVKLYRFADVAATARRAGGAGVARVGSAARRA